MPEMNDCPLSLRGVTATVTSTGRGFAIEVRSEDVGTATEIKRRAEGRGLGCSEIAPWLARALNRI